MKQIIDNIQKSIYGPQFYVEILRLPMRSSIKYFFALVLLLSVFFTIVTSIPLVSQANRLAHEFPTKFFAYFPDDFELTITNGAASSNVGEPYFFPVPLEFKSDAEKEGIENVIVIDTKNAFSIDQFNAYKSAVWVGASQVAYHDKRGSVRIEPFDKELNFVLNESKLRNAEAKISPYYGFLGPIIVIAIFVGLWIALSINLIYLFFGAVLILLLGKFMKLNVTYWKSYQIGLHAITLALLIDTLLSMTGFFQLRVPLAPTLTMLLVVYVNYKNYRPLESTNEAPSPIAIVAPKENDIK